MQVKLEFFGPVRDRIGGVPDTLILDVSPPSLDRLAAILASQIENGDVLRDPHLRFAINDQLVTPEQRIKLGEGDRIAILSPFSGG